MTENTADPAPSSPPSFMQKAETAKDKVARDSEREEQASNGDMMDKRRATLDKATSRLSEQVDYLGRIDAAVAVVLFEFIAKHPLGEVLEKFVALEDQINALEKAFKLIKEKISMVREVSFPERLEAEDMRTFTGDNGDRVSKSARVFASIVSDPTGDTQQKAYQWLRDNELGALIKETVNSSSLSGAAKELMESGREMPEDLFKVHMKDGVSITRSKKKG